MAGLVNLGLFLVGFRRFVVTLTGSTAAAAYALLFTLVLWGPGLVWSGFLKLNSIGLVLSYASTFATALMYFAFERQLRREGSLRRSVVLVPLMTLILVTHTPTALATFIGVLAIAASSPEGVAKEIAITVIAIATSVGLALGWPYYSLFELVTSFSSAYQFGNRFAYGLQTARAFATGDRIAIRVVLPDVLPALVGLPLLLVRLRERPRDPLVLMFLGLLLAYVYGAVSRQWSYGRVMPTLVAALHVAAADWLARAEAAWRAGRRSPLQGMYIGLVAATCVYAAVPLIATARDYLPGHRWPLTTTHEDYDFLAKWVGPDDVVITCSPIVAAIAGKLIAAGTPDFPLAFVADDVQRRQDLDLLLRPHTPLARRQEIVTRYHARFALLEPKCMTFSTIADLRSLGEVVAVQGRLSLVSITTGATR
jgi:hypothetical protein